MHNLFPDSLKITSLPEKSNKQDGLQNGSNTVVPFILHEVSRVVTIFSSVLGNQL